MLEQHAYDPTQPNFCRRCVQRGPAFIVLRAYIRTTLEQGAHDLDTRTSRSHVQRGSAFVVLRTDIRTMLEQHAHDLELLIIRNVRPLFGAVTAYVQRGVAVLVPRSYIRTMLEQHAC